VLDNQAIIRYRIKEQWFLFWLIEQGSIMTIVENAEHIAGKICRACGDWKPLAEYSRRMEHDVPTGDGFQNGCKPCRSSAEMVRYRAKGEAAKTYLRDQYTAHRERRLADMRMYRTINRDKVLAQKRDHYTSIIAQVEMQEYGNAALFLHFANRTLIHHLARISNNTGHGRCDCGDRAGQEGARARPLATFKIAIRA
jgi:hypothetical protein